MNPAGRIVIMPCNENVTAEVMAARKGSDSHSFSSSCCTWEYSVETNPYRVARGHCALWDLGVV